MGETTTACPAIHTNTTCISTSCVTGSCIWSVWNCACVCWFSYFPVTLQVRRTWSMSHHAAWIWSAWELCVRAITYWFPHFVMLAECNAITHIPAMFHVLTMERKNLCAQMGNWEFESHCTPTCDVQLPQELLDELHARHCTNGTQTRICSYIVSTRDAEQNPCSACWGSYLFPLAGVSLCCWHSSWVQWECTPCKSGL